MDAGVAASPDAAASRSAPDVRARPNGYRRSPLVPPERRATSPDSDGSDIRTHAGETNIQLLLRLPGSRASDCSPEGGIPSTSEGFSMEDGPRPLSSVALQGRRRRTCQLPTFLAISLLSVTISVVCTVPLMLLSTVNGNTLGDHLLADAARSKFQVLYRSTQAALDEADSRMAFVEQWLCHTATSVSDPATEPALRHVMFSWIASARRTGGLCLSAASDGGPWSRCASRVASGDGVRLFWGFNNGTAMAKAEVDDGWELVGNGPACGGACGARPPLALEDHELGWLPPRVRSDTLSDGSRQTLTEIGQKRLVPTPGGPVLSFLWMDDPDWAVVLDEVGAAVPAAAAAFVFSSGGALLASTCGTCRAGGELLSATQSGCDIVRRTYEWLQASGHAEAAAFSGQGLVRGQHTLVNLRRLNTSRGEATPYTLALSYPFSQVDRPVRDNFLAMLLTSASLLVLTSLAACWMAWMFLRLPLRDLASEMDQCVQLKFQSHAPCVPWLSELSSISRCFHKMKATLMEVAKLVPVEVVKQSLTHGLRLEVCMNPTHASIFFLDIVGFTTLTETTPLHVLVPSLAEFFEWLSDIIVCNYGTIDKYIGDCVMAIWNAPHRVPDHEYHACCAALQCVSHIKTPRGARVSLRGRIGLESGPVYAGMFGSRHRMNYTVVGDAVNLASRLEGLNKEYNTDILIGPKMFEAVAGRFHARKIPGVAVKGKAEKLTVYELVPEEQVGIPLRTWSTDGTFPIEGELERERRVSMGDAGTVDAPASPVTPLPHEVSAGWSETPFENDLRVRSFPYDLPGLSTQVEE